MAAKAPPIPLPGGAYVWTGEALILWAGTGGLVEWVNTSGLMVTADRGFHGSVNAYNLADFRKALEGPLRLAPFTNLHANLQSMEDVDELLRLDVGPRLSSLQVNLQWRGEYAFLDDITEAVRRLEASGQFGHVSRLDLYARTEEGFDQAPIIDLLARGRWGRLRHLGLSWREAVQLWDVDRPTDVRRMRKEGMTELLAGIDKRP